MEPWVHISWGLLCYWGGKVQWSKSGFHGLHLSSSTWLFLVGLSRTFEMQWALWLSSREPPFTNFSGGFTWRKLFFFTQHLHAFHPPQMSRAAHEGNRGHCASGTFLELNFKALERSLPGIGLSSANSVRRAQPCPPLMKGTSWLPGAGHLSTFIALLTGHSNNNPPFLVYYSLSNNI